MRCPAGRPWCQMCEEFPFRFGCFELQEMWRLAQEEYSMRKGLSLHTTSLRAYSAREVSDDTAVDTGSVGPVQQQFADEVNVNTIVRRFGITREMPSGREGGVYGDFTGIVDYDSAVEAVQRAQDGFLALDPDVRLRFGNDPGQYLAYVDQLTDEELGPDVGVPAPEEPAVPEPQRVIVVSESPQEGGGAVPAP